MKKILYGLCFICFSMGANASTITNNFGLTSPANTITFDEVVFSQGTSVDTQYASYGVTFSPALHYDAQAGTWAGIDGHHLGNFHPITNPISVFFNATQSEAAFSFASNTQTTTFDALLNGALVETFSLVTTSGDPAQTFYGFANILFNEIRITGDGSSNDAFLMDNIQLSAVPVPAAAWLFGSALLGFFGFSRKKANA